MVHGTDLRPDCARCAPELSPEQWAARRARAAGATFSVPLCRHHGCPRGTCCLTYDGEA